MTKLTEVQKNFIYKTFFKNSNYAGWGAVAEKLLTKGKCIVAGTKCIWVGGIGNYIKTKEAEEAVDCLEYTFDLNSFLKSNYFKEELKFHVLQCEARLEILKKDLDKLKINLVD
jgi:hypothetical protein